MKILIVDKKRFSKTDLNFLLILEENEIFEKTIKGIRRKFGYPEEGYQTELTPEGKIKIINFTEDARKQINHTNKWINEPIKDLISAFRLPVCWWITKDRYEKKRKEFREKQREIKEKMNKLYFTDERVLFDLRIPAETSF